MEAAIAKKLISRELDFNYNTNFMYSTFNVIYKSNGQININIDYTNCKVSIININNGEHYNDINEMFEKIKLL